MYKDLPLVHKKLGLGQGFRLAPILDFLAPLQVFMSTVWSLRSISDPAFATPTLHPHQTEVTDQLKRIKAIGMYEMRFAKTTWCWGSLALLASPYMCATRRTLTAVHSPHPFKGHRNCEKCTSWNCEMYYNCEIYYNCEVYVVEL